MAWLTFLTTEALLAQLDREMAARETASHAACTAASAASLVTHSGCVLPEGEALTEVAWASADVLPRLPGYLPLAQPNEALLKHFRNGLHLSGYGPAGRLVYGYAVRLALSWIAQDWRDIDVATDWARARDHIVHWLADQPGQVMAPPAMGPSMAPHVLTGLDLFAEYLSIRQQRRLLPRSARMRAPWPATQPPEPPPEPDVSTVLEEALDEADATAQPHPADHAGAPSGCVAMKVMRADGHPERRRFVKSVGASNGAPRSVIRPVLLVPVRQWPSSNQTFYQHFRNWLHWSGYSPSALYLYGLAVRFLFSLIDQDWRDIDPAADLDAARAWLHIHQPSAATCQTYLKGLAKFGQYLRLRQGRQLGRQLSRPSPTATPTQTYPGRSHPTRHPSLTPLPDAILHSVAEYRDHCARHWPQPSVEPFGNDLVRRVTQPMRWLVDHGIALDAPDSLTPRLWWQYADARLAEGITQTTLNGTLTALLGWLRWRAEQQHPIDARMLLLKPLKEAKPLPKDVPLTDLRRLQAAIVAEASSLYSPTRRRGTMDLAWFLLMLHAGLRTGEVRRLTFGDIDWERRLIRIEQSKGLKDRLVPFSPEAGQALQHYLALREHETALTDLDRDIEADQANHAGRIVFLDRHQPLSASYCLSRLQTYGQRVGVRCSPHQLRHSCATLLLNSGMPVVSVQALLGHKWIETTLGYARLYDGTLAADYTRAMLSVEHQGSHLLPGAGDAAPLALAPAQLVALADAVRTAGTLNAQQLDALAALRAGLVVRPAADADP